ncbi:hypothetical protein DPMN_164508 [Dreissena polymorpha]|uniref:Uncharacterized protein n=1 Tax=Dreissena polymorpha TaxID=45954 RepID=A0A9D4EXY0_DREPO|nr:hypothetical protein DPMN_164508 [Dreissena polymorpha]
MADTHLYTGLREAIPISPAPFIANSLIAESKIPVRTHVAETNYADCELLENDSQDGKNYESVNKEYQFVK